MRTHKTIAEEESSIDIYDLPQRLEDSIRLVKADEDVSPKNRKLILDFDTYNKRNSVGIPARRKYHSFLRPVAAALDKDFDKATREDFKVLLDRIQESDYSAAAKFHQIKILCRFMKWLKNPGVDEAEWTKPKEISWIQTSKFKPKKIPLNPAVLLDVKDIQHMTDACINLRDRALVGMFFETGARVGELASMRVQDVQEVESGGFLLLSRSKTEPRRVFVATFWPDLARWLAAHPHKADLAAPLWVNLLPGYQHQPMKYWSIVKVIKVAAKRAGVSGKRVNLHSLRHASASHFSHTNLSESELKRRFGWSMSSTQLSTYIHSSDDKIKDKMLGKPSETLQPPQPKKCWNCGALINGLASRCVECGKSVDFQKVVDRQHAYLKLFADFNEFMRQHPDKDTQAAALLQGG